MSNNITNEAVYSQLESNRFNKKIYRGVFDRVDEKKLLSIILSNTPDIMIIRVPVENQDDIHKLDKLNIPYIVADTLVYYYVDLNNHIIAEARNKNLEFVECMPEHESIINELVDEIFIGYTNHYHANPYLDKKDILEGYKQWARNYISKYSDDKICWLIKRDGEFIGFATCAFDKEQNEAEGVLYGVRPSASGGGVYGDIIKFTQNYFKNAGYSSMKVSTQIQNFAVQKVWAREGFVLKKAYNTVHINALMECTEYPKKTFQLKVTEQDVEKFGELSGDFNPVHFSDEYAKSKKFEGRISHGVIVSAILSKYFGMDYPGNGTLFLTNSIKFIRPIYINRDYVIDITFPYINSSNGIHRAFMKVYDKNGGICLYGYSDLHYKNN